MCSGSAWKDLAIAGRPVAMTVESMFCMNSAPPTMAAVRRILPVEMTGSRSGGSASGKGFARGKGVDARMRGQDGEVKTATAQINKSFLVLFFKKELLAYFRHHATHVGIFGSRGQVTRRGSDRQFAGARGRRTSGFGIPRRAGAKNPRKKCRCRGRRKKSGGWRSCRLARWR